jgi:hypothetical protein
VTHQIGQVGPEFEAVEADTAGTGIEMSLRLGQGGILLCLGFNLDPDFGVVCSTYVLLGFMMP